MKKIISGLILITILFTVLSACALNLPTSTLEATRMQSPVDLKVGVFPYLSYAAFYIAEQEGYFAEQGLNVELVSFFGAIDQVIPALITKQLDITGLSSRITIFNAVYDGSNVKIVSGKGYINPDGCADFAWVGSKASMADGTLSTQESIAGLSVVVPPGTPMEYSLDLLLSKNGLTQDDINLVNIAKSAARIDALSNNSIQVSTMTEPWITRTKAAGAGDVWVPYSELIPNMTVGVIVFGPSILNDNPEAGKAFMVAYLQAVEKLSQGKTDRNVELVAEYTGMDPEEIKVACWPSFRADGAIDTESLLGFQDWAFEKGYLNGTLSLDQVWNSEFLDSALMELGEQ